MVLENFQRATSPRPSMRRASGDFRRSGQSTVSRVLPANLTVRRTVVLPAGASHLHTSGPANAAPGSTALPTIDATSSRVSRRHASALLPPAGAAAAAAPSGGPLLPPQPVGSN